MLERSLMTRRYAVPAFSFVTFLRCMASPIVKPGPTVPLTVHRVDLRPLRSVEARRLESDGLVVTLGRDVDDDAARGDVLDGEAERRAADSVDDHVEVAGDVLDDVGGAQAAEELLRCRRVAHQRGDVGAALAGELDRDPPDAAGCAGDQYALAEYEAGDLERPQRRQTGGGQRGGLRVGHPVAD